MGYLIAGVRAIEDARVGDTVVDARCDEVEALPGLPTAQADGVQRLVPGGLGRLRLRFAMP